MPSSDSTNETTSHVGIPVPSSGPTLVGANATGGEFVSRLPEPRRIGRPAIPEASDREMAAPQETIAQTAATRHVLIVDDEELTRSMIARNLGSHGLQILQAAGAKEALHILNRERVDLVLMDISMPIFDGFSTLRLIRQKFSATRLPVIMMTSLEGRDQILESFRNGANDYIAKPVDFDVLFARVKSIFHLQDAQAALFESEERYALVSQGTNDGMWDWNLQTNQL
ncbi:MAG: response regulator, partial [Planctomycetota bacterium]